MAIVARITVPGRAITPTLVVCLGLSQLVAWGTMHYLIALFAAGIAADLGWSATFVQAGFSLGLVTMGLASRPVGAWIDRDGGRPAMMAGCWCGAAGCVLLATMAGPAQYLLAWLLLGLGMRLALYDAAFAALAHVGGASAKRAMAFITVFGGLASTVFWPLGQALASALGWRGALLAYAAFLVAASALHRAIPRRAAAGQATAAPAGAQATGAVVPVPGARLLYGAMAASVLCLQTAMASQFLLLLRALGWSAATAVSVAALLGVGQFLGRCSIALWAHRFDAVRLNLLPGALQCLCFVCYLAAGHTLAGGAAFAFFYGLGNGIATYTRGAMPLVLFDAAHYGRTVGAVLRPALALAAAAPMVFAFVMDRGGHRATVGLALALAGCALTASLLLFIGVERRRQAP